MRLGALQYILIIPSTLTSGDAGVMILRKSYDEVIPKFKRKTHVGREYISY